MSPTRPSLFLSVIPVVFLVAALAINVAVFGDNATGGPNQLALLLAAGVAALVARTALGFDYARLERGAIDAIGLSMQAVLILLSVGALIGLWITAGIIPTLIYYGIHLINPAVFLVVACAACSLVSLAIGSSWSTMGTLGVALIGAGRTLGVPDGMVAGAVISGAYFGDKLSPLSDTTNLAPAIAGTDLFTHVRHLLYTTLPAISIALVAFGILGLRYAGDGYDAAIVSEVSGALTSTFSIGIHTLSPLVVLLTLILIRVPALPAILCGVLLGAVQTIAMQPSLLPSGSETQSLLAAAFGYVVTTAHSGSNVVTGNDLVDSLVSRGGMLGMLPTVLLILMAMAFGGVMEVSGMLPRIASAILALVRNTASLIAATIATCIAFNWIASEQYLAIVVPGRMFRTAYRDRGLDARNLSRALEDGGTVTSVFVPWNTCGAFAATILTVPTFSYAPFAIFNWLCPIVAIGMAAAGVGIQALETERERPLAAIEPASESAHT